MEEKPVLLDNAAIEPAMNIANRLLSALGRTQVNWQLLLLHYIVSNNMSKSFISYKKQIKCFVNWLKALSSLERVSKNLRNKPYAEVKEQSDLAVSSLGQTIPALQSLRNWGLATLAGQMGV